MYYQVVSCSGSVVVVKKFPNTLLFLQHASSNIDVNMSDQNQFKEV